MSLDDLYEIKTYAQPAQETPWYQQTSTYIIGGLSILGACAIALAIRKYNKKVEPTKMSDSELKKHLTKRWMKRPPNLR